jgi:hypothetical protein
MRKRYGVILAVIGYIVFFFCMEGWGADWKIIGKSVPGDLWEIDMTNISRQPDNILTVWVKVTHSKKSVSDFVKERGEKYKDVSYSIQLDEYNCTEKKHRTLSGADYSLGGVIDSGNSHEEWKFIIPDSVGDGVFKEVCK